MWRVSGTPVLAYDEFAKTLRLPHQLQPRREPQAALAGECNGLEFRALTIAGAGNPDADLVAAKHRILALRRRVLLVDDFALPATVRGAVGAEIIKEGVAAENAAVDQQHHAGQAAIDTVEGADVDRIEPIDDAALPDLALGWERLVVEPHQVRPEQRAGPRCRAAFEANLVAGHPTPHADRGDIGSHQRLVVGIVVVAFGNDL